MLLGNLKTQTFRETSESALDTAIAAFVATISGVTGSIAQRTFVSIQYQVVLDGATELHCALLAYTE